MEKLNLKKHWPYIILAAIFALVVVFPAIWIGKNITPYIWRAIVIVFWLGRLGLTLFHWTAATVVTFVVAWKKRRNWKVLVAEIAVWAGLYLAQGLLTTASQKIGWPLVLAVAAFVVVAAVWAWLGLTEKGWKVFGDLITAVSKVVKSESLAVKNEVKVIEPEPKHDTTEPVLEQTHTYNFGDDYFNPEITVADSAPIGSVEIDCVNLIGHVGYPRKITAFTIRIWDENAFTVNNLVLSSIHAYDDPEIRPKIESTGGDSDEISIIGLGAIPIETQTMRIQIRVTELEYDESAPYHSVFQKVVFEIEIHVKDIVEAPPAEEAPVREPWLKRLLNNRAFQLVAQAIIAGALIWGEVELLGWGKTLWAICNYLLIAGVVTWMAWTWNGFLIYILDWEPLKVVKSIKLLWDRRRSQFDFEEKALLFFTVILTVITIAILLFAPARMPNAEPSTPTAIATATPADTAELANLRAENAQLKADLANLEEDLRFANGNVEIAVGNYNIISQTLAFREADLLRVSAELTTTLAANAELSATLATRDRWLDEATDRIVALDEAVEDMATERDSALDERDAISITLQTRNAEFSVREAEYKELQLWHCSVLYKYPGIWLGGPLDIGEGSPLGCKDPFESPEAKAQGWNWDEIREQAAALPNPQLEAACAKVKTWWEPEKLNPETLPQCNIYWGFEE